MKKPGRESLLLARLLQKLAPRIGASVLIEPEWGIAGKITFKNGKKSYFKYNALDLNPVGSSDIAKDKDYANFFMAHMGYPTVRGKAFFSDEWCKIIDSKRNITAAYLYAKKLGFPVITKPNSGSHGNGVFLVRTKHEFLKAVRHIFKYDRVALVQQVARGKDYRIVVLDNEIISAYERIPLNIVGDGSSNIRTLLKEKQRQFIKSNRDTRIRLDDPRMKQKLHSQGLSLHSIPRRGERVYLLDNANLSSGGDATDVTKTIHPEFKKFAIKLTKDMGLRLCGVDVMVDGDIRNSPSRYWVLEVNAAPGLDHYVKTGRSQEKIVEDLYLKILKSLAR